MLLASNLLNFPKLVVNELKKYIPKILYQFSFFYLSYGCFMLVFEELITEELDNFTKVLINKVFTNHELPFFEL